MCRLSGCLTSITADIPHKKQCSFQLNFPILDRILFDKDLPSSLMSLLLSLSQSLMQSVLQIFSSLTLKDYQPAYLADLLVRLKCSKYLRSTNSNNFVVPHIKTKTRPRAFSLSEPYLWNAGHVPIRNAKTILLFLLLWPRLWHMITLGICAPPTSVGWGYRRYRSFIDWFIRIDFANWYSWWFHSQICT